MSSAPSLPPFFPGAPVGMMQAIPKAQGYGLRTVFAAMILSSAFSIVLGFLLCRRMKRMALVDTGSIEELVSRMVERTRSHVDQAPVAPRAPRAPSEMEAPLGAGSRWTPLS